MKLMSINMARSLWFFSVEELNPHGDDMWPIYKAAIDRYAVQSFPTTNDMMKAYQENTASPFTGGKFKLQSGRTIAADFSIYRDGIMGDTRSSTADTDEFLSDLVRWMQSQVPSSEEKIMPRRITYLSQIVFSSAAKMAMMNPKLEAFEKRLEASFPKGELQGLEFSSVGFWVDPDKRTNAARFRVERLEATPFSENRYWSQGPFDTERHLDLIRSFEEILSS